MSNYNPNSIDAAVSRVETTVKGIDEKIDNVFFKLERHDKRISRLERTRIWLLGASSAAGVVFGGLLSFLKKAIFTHI